MLTPSGRTTATPPATLPQTAPTGSDRVQDGHGLRIDAPTQINPPHFIQSQQRAVIAYGSALDHHSLHAPPPQLESDATLGFLTVVELADKGFVGGLLATNVWGRPLEFQCTTPVKPNRAQQILYGSTLRPFVFGELIGPALISKVDAEPALVLSDLQDVLPMRLHVDVPVVALQRAAVTAPVLTASSAADGQKWQPQCHANHRQDARVVAALLESHDRLPELAEPFERIRLCIEEVYP